MKKKQYTKEFRLQAIELAERLGNASEAARQLGIADGSIHQWKVRLKNGSKGSGPSSSGTDAEEMSRLRRENAELKKVNHILKSAAAFFSQDHLK